MILAGSLIAIYGSASAQIKLNINTNNAQARDLTFNYNLITTNDEKGNSMTIPGIASANDMKQAIKMFSDEFNNDAAGFKDIASPSHLMVQFPNTVNGKTQVEHCQLNATQLKEALVSSHPIELPNTNACQEK